MKIGFLGLLTLLFITLKLTGHITWSWQLVLAPLLLPAALYVAVITAPFILGWLVVLGAAAWVWWDEKRG